MSEKTAKQNEGNRFLQYHPLTLIAIPTEQSYQIVINYGLNRAEAYSLFCDAILECVRLQKGIFSGA